MFSHSFISFFIENSLSVQLGQIAVFILLLSFFLIIKSYKLGLIVSYFLVFLWVFVINFSRFQALLENFYWWGLPIFLFCGFVMGLLLLYSLFKN